MYVSDFAYEFLCNLESILVLFWIKRTAINESILI